MMAAIEKGEGASDAVVKGWLARAVTAPRGPSWVCDNCGTVHSEWASTCSNCGALDTMTWTDPPNEDGVAPRGADMLPLLVGQDEPEDEADDTVMDAVITPANDDAEASAKAS